MFKEYTRLMGLKDQVAADLTTSMRARDSVRTGTLRMLRAAIQNYEVARTDPKNPQHGQPVTEGDLLAIVEREIKQRRESVDAFRKAGRTDLAEKEEAEQAILAEYLPAQLSREEIADHVRAIVAETGPDFRAVMPRAARELRGRADGRLVNEVVKELTA